MRKSESRRVWTVAEAKARLSEVLRLAEEEGPQRIGASANWGEKMFRRRAGGAVAGENGAR